MPEYRILNVRQYESGAALVTAILVTFLLGTACIAMLSAVGASSRNTTDVLSETKAYYAAESGIQAAINVFRNNSVNYNQAAAHPSLQYDAGNFPAGVTYTNGRVVVDGESSYGINITDPDNSAGAIGYHTQGTFKLTGTTHALDPYTSTLAVISGSTTFTFSFVSHTQTTVTPGMLNGEPFGSIQVVKTGTATALPAAVNFRIDYVMTDPREGTRTIRGTIGTNGAVTFVANTFTLMGSTITLCNSSAGCAPPSGYTLSLAGSTSSQAVYGKMTALEPYRLKLVSTGYGPSGSKKVLEAIVQRNFLNDLGSSSAISLLGPNAFFATGNSTNMDINGGNLPSVTVTDSQGLQTVLDNRRVDHMLPPPEIAGNDIPDWQQSPSTLDALVRQLRQSAQNSGRYFSGTAPSGWGNFSAGTGITFCEGDCTMSGSSMGGGILVVTGTFRTSGSPRFNGLVLAVGRYVDANNPGGIVRNGGGQENFTGNIVVAPYDPNNLSAGFEQPRYDQRGGPGDTILSDVIVDSAFDGTSAITDFVLGVAEK